MTGPLTNRITLDAMRAMPIGEIAALPAEELAVLQEEAGEALKAAKNLKEWLEGAIALKYGERAAQARAGAGKDTGTVRFADGAVTVAADLPKKVEWDQRQLASLVERIRESGDDPTQYISIEFAVSERAFGAWPERIRQTFAPARTVKTGKQAFKLSVNHDGGL
jgi:hypothetical protein